MILFITIIYFRFTEGNTIRLTIFKNVIKIATITIRFNSWLVSDTIKPVIPAS